MFTNKEISIIKTANVAEINEIKEDGVYAGKSEGKVSQLGPKFPLPKATNSK